MSETHTAVNVSLYDNDMKPSPTTRVHFLTDPTQQVPHVGKMRRTHNVEEHPQACAFSDENGCAETSSPVVAKRP